MPTAARVHRRNELEAGREGHAARGPGAVGATLPERLAAKIQAVAEGQPAPVAAVGQGVDIPAPLENADAPEPAIGAAGDRDIPAPVQSDVPGP